MNALDFGVMALMALMVLECINALDPHKASWLSF
jgi:hypothetical protein